LPNPSTSKSKPFLTETGQSATLQQLPIRAIPGRPFLTLHVPDM
jgi:hypothetical protein